MEDSAIITCLKNFDSVWERVTHVDAAPGAECGILSIYPERQYAMPEPGQNAGKPEKAICRSECSSIFEKHGDEKYKQDLSICRSVAKNREITVLRGFMDAERDREAGYRAMCCSAKGRCAAQLRALANGCAAMVKEMQLEHFLITGDTWVTTGRNVPAERGLSRLRALYIDELLAGNEYALQVSASEIEPLKLMYRRFSGRCADMASAVRAVIAEAIK